MLWRIYFLPTDHPWLSESSKMCFRTRKSSTLGISWKRTVIVRRLPVDFLLPINSVNWIMSHWLVFNYKIIQLAFYGSITVLLNQVQPGKKWRRSFSEKKTLKDYILFTPYLVLRNTFLGVPHRIEFQLICTVQPAGEKKTRNVLRDNFKIFGNLFYEVSKESRSIEVCRRVFKATGLRYIW